MPSTFLSWLTVVADVVGVIGAIFAFMAWLILQVERKKLRRHLDELPKMGNFDDLRSYHEGVKTPKPCGLAICLLENIRTIGPEVERFLKGKGYSMPVKTIDFYGITPDNLKDFVDALRQAKMTLSEEDFTEVHLFIAGPVQAATLAGAMFEHWKPVKLYHKNRATNEYEYWCSLMK